MTVEFKTEEGANYLKCRMCNKPAFEHLSHEIKKGKYAGNIAYCCSQDCLDLLEWQEARMDKSVLDTLTFTEYQRNKEVKAMEEELKKNPPKLEDTTPINIDTTEEKKPVNEVVIEKPKRGRPKKQ